MTCACPAITLSPRDHDAVLFDLDGVLTRTARVHAAAWKRVFDDFLRRRSVESGAPFVEFDSDDDYRRHVDGKPRTDGVVAFLESRNIELAPDARQALASRKDEYFVEQLKELGVETYDAAVTLVRALRARGIKTAVVSSSMNCKAVLERAGIAELFDARVDGVDLTSLGLAGKPAPDTFLEAARRLSVEPSRAVVVEDALAGVAAGRAGGFGCVIGVDRRGQSLALRDAGADVVVLSLAQVRVASEAPSAWSLVFEGLDPEREGIRESLCTLGNGYFATRAAAPWAVADDTHYPGTYLAGGYNRLRTEIAGREVETEDLVNLPNWLMVELRIAGEDRFDPRTVTILSYRQELDLRRGLLLRTIRFEDRQGRRSRLDERRFVSMSDTHLGAMELSLKAENWSGRVELLSAIDGRVVNGGAKLYRRFNNQHLIPLGEQAVGDDGTLLLTRTSQSNLHVAQAARTHVFVDGKPVASQREVQEAQGFIGQALSVELREGQTLALEKIAVIFTSRDHAISECGLEARKAIGRAGRFDALLAEHVLSWEHLWRRFEVDVQPGEPGFKFNLPMLLRLNIFHLLQTASPHSIGLDIGVPARGWTGEAYQGHVFWDELFIFPTLNYRMPEIARALLMYRHRRLREARAAARAAGFRGAMFPWQSGSDGQEETQAFNLNPRSERWVPDNSYLQRHVGSAIAYNVWQYFQVTHDLEFLEAYGAELILDIAHFWSSIARFNEARGRYEIHGVMGPDEFHEGYPGAASPGLRNNAYTNLMAVWVLCRALEALELLSEIRRSELTAQLGLSAEELGRWAEISRKMFIPFFDDGLICQFEGYEKLRELDWQRYRERYGNIQRLDLILEAEKDSTNNYKLSKQADVLMLFYLFSAEELGALFERLGYPFEYETIPKNVAYYAARSSHGSTLCRVVYAWVLARSDRPSSMKFFAEALQSDVSDIQQGTTREGVHLGAMAGSVDLIQRVSTGLEVKGDVLRIDPELPRELERLDMRIRYRGHSLDLGLTRQSLTVRGCNRDVAPISLRVDGEVCELVGGATRTFPLNCEMREEPC